jgi:hypothetical protein
MAFDMYASTRASLWLNLLWSGAHQSAVFILGGVDFIEVYKNFDGKAQGVG